MALCVSTSGPDAQRHPQVRRGRPRYAGYPTLCEPVKNGVTQEVFVRYFLLALRDAFRAYRRSKQYHYPSSR
jgi:hypothetical protein